jgi:Trypsin-like peptidase domain
MVLIIGLMALSFAPSDVLVRLFYGWVTRPPDPTPPPPTIWAEAGVLPGLPVGLREWSKSAGGDYDPIGSGFLLRLDDGSIVAVTTAHSVGDLGAADNTVERIAFEQYGQPGYVLESDTLYGPPGMPRWGDDLTIDWLLLKVDTGVDAALVLEADPRGHPQPGEAVLLYSGRGDGITLGGTVQSVGTLAVWVLMDPTDYPNGMSGSPLISAHTGNVVGMAIATTPRAGRFLMGFHPIDSIVEKAGLADVFVKIDEFDR